MNCVRGLASLRVGGTAVVASAMVFAAACESGRTNPAAPTTTVGAAVPITVGASEGTKTLAIDALVGNWRGLYSWDCGSRLVGAETVTFSIDRSTGPGLYSGSASYLGGRATATVQRFVGNINDQATWSPSPDGSIVEIEVPQSPGNFANNEFTGLLDGSQIVGTTLNGDTEVFPGATGCSALTGPSGTFSIGKL